MHGFDSFKEIITFDHLFNKNYCDMAGMQKGEEMKEEHHMLAAVLMLTPMWIRTWIRAAAPTATPSPMPTPTPTPRVFPMEEDYLAAAASCLATELKDAARREGRVK